MCSVLRSDQRGFALQTVIVMTALIAIAMAVSAVILTRGGEVVVDLEQQNITSRPNPADLSNEWECTGWKYAWDGTTCSEPAENQ